MIPKLSYLIWQLGWVLLSKNTSSHYLVSTGIYMLACITSCRRSLFWETLHIFSRPVLMYLNCSFNNNREDTTKRERERERERDDVRTDSLWLCNMSEGLQDLFFLNLPPSLALPCLSRVIARLKISLFSLCSA